MQSQLRSFYLLCLVVVLCIMTCPLAAQGELSSKNNSEVMDRLVFYDYRGTNVLDVAVGTSVINGDLPDAQFEIYFKAGYKRFIIDHLNIGIAYNKYNVAFKDIYNEGFMSFDLNLEYIFNPYNRVTPFVYAGGGYNAANYFENASSKLQGGAGIEYIVFDGLGIKLFAEYNYMLDDTLDGLESGDSDDILYRIGFGFNVYFGGQKRKAKTLDALDTVIKSNPILPKN